ncbi:MAG TPA: flagellar biosynthesis protein FlhF [Polyangiaceae bacterium]
MNVQYQAFRGADLKEALEQVKATLGPNALIDATRQITNGHPGALERSYVEVTAAAPAGLEWPFATPTAGARRSATERRGERGGRKPEPQRQGFSLLAGQAAPSDVERELMTLRAMVEELNATLPPKERALAMLHSMGIEGVLARELGAGAGRHAKKGREALRGWLMARIRERIAVRPRLIDADGPTLIACVGPTGVGKTTTLAKLAARARLDLGKSVSVISLDTFRVGAIEQWQRYASLMGVPFHVAHELSGFQRVLRDSKSDLILVDTAGRSAHSGGGLLAEGLRGVTTHDVHVQLVVPAWLRANDAERVLASYQDPTPTEVVITKLDETETFGGALHAALPRGLPLAYLCDGPRVPEDIEEASVDRVLGRLFPTP